MVELSFSSRNNKDGKTSVAGAGCGVLFGLVFVLMGGLFLVVIAKEFLSNLDARGWEEVPAVLEKAEVTDDRNAEEPFTLEVAYSYDFEGRKYQGTRYTLKPKADESYDKLERKARDLREDSELVAKVDPDDPSSAILKAETLWTGLFILLPLVFVAVGAGIMIASIRSRKKAKEEESGKIESISSSPTSNKTGGAWVGMIVGGIFLLVGLGMLYPLGVKPLAMANSARNWVETPCKIIWAEVRSHTGDDSTTYSVDIFYRYEFEGQWYKSNRYSYLTGSSSGRSSKQEAVDRYRKAKVPVCYVDPDKPERAILKRELGLQGLIVLLPTLFAFLGGLVFALSLRSFRKTKRAKAEPNPLLQIPSPLVPPAMGGPAPKTRPCTMSPGKSRLTMVVVLFCVALFWNGMVFGLLFPEAWVRGEGGIFLKLFSIPFMLVGVGILVGFFYTLLGLFNPKPILTLDPCEPMLGEEFALRWHLKGSARRLKKLRLVLRGFEKATYQRGTDTVTDEENFFALLLSEHTDPTSMYQGTATASIPKDSMHSFKASNNEIVWKLEAEGDIPYWPDISDDYDVVVHPAPVRQT